MRRALWSKTKGELDSCAPGRQNIGPAVVGLRLEEWEHGLLVIRIPGFGNALGVILFGQAGWLVEMGADAPEDLVLFVVDVRNRKMRRLETEDLMREQRFDFSTPVVSPYR